MEHKNNFFSIFGLPVKFDIDLSELTSRYRQLQKNLHPDKYASGSGSERSVSVRQAAMINDAYNVLKSPLSRARYMLEIGGMALNDEANTIMEPDFLMQQMELRESLEAVKSASDPLANLDELSDMLARHSENINSKLIELFNQEAVDLQMIAAEVRKFQFFSRLQEEAESLYARYENL